MPRSDRAAARGTWESHIAAAMAAFPAEQSDMLRLAVARLRTEFSDEA